MLLFVGLLISALFYLERLQRLHFKIMRVYFVLV